MDPVSERTANPTVGLASQFVARKQPIVVLPRGYRQMPVAYSSGSQSSARSTTVSRLPSAGLVPCQFAPSLSSSEAYAACGPAAAVAFARSLGRSPSLRQVLDLAKTVGWTPQGGMNGVVNQKRLLEKMGIPARLDCSQGWDSVAESVAAGTPVAISTPGHYFVADGYDPRTRQFHVGASGTAYRNGKEWMTREEIESLAGRMNGSLVIDSRRDWLA